jgi:hypothetical protein
MKTVRLTLVIATSLLLAIAAGAQTHKKTSEPARSLGVSLALPDGHFIAYPIQKGTRPENLLPIPLSGYRNVFGIRMYPHMSGDKVAVRIWAMVPKTPVSEASAPPDPTKVPHKHQLIGDYVLGHNGDSMQIADLKKVGLPALTAKVVLAPFSTKSPSDPCCCTTDGLTCCGPTFALMCASCPCPICGNGVKGKNKIYTLDVQPHLVPKSQGSVDKKR